MSGNCRVSDPDCSLLVCCFDQPPDLLCQLCDVCFDYHGTVADVEQTTFWGFHWCVALTYFGQTNEMHVTALKKLGKRVKDTIMRVRDSLFALHSLGLGCGFLIGTSKG